MAQLQSLPTPDRVGIVSAIAYGLQLQPTFFALDEHLLAVLEEALRELQGLEVQLGGDADKAKDGSGSGSSSGGSSSSGSSAVVLGPIATARASGPHGGTQSGAAAALAALSGMAHTHAHSFSTRAKNKEYHASQEYLQYSVLALAEK